MGIFDRFTRKGAKTSETGSPEAGPGESGGADSRPAGDGEAVRSNSGWLGRIRQGLQRTGRLLQTDIRDLFKHDGELVDDTMLDRLFALLVKTDMGAGPAETIRDQVGREFRGRVVQQEDLVRVVRDQLYELLHQEEAPLALQTDPPTVILVVGVNGSGKTTSIAKLARMLIQEGHRVVLGAGDTFRAAAVEQLTIWAERLGAEIVTGPAGSDPASVAHRTVAKALESGADVCILDTAGRLQTQSNLMDQLTKIRRVVEKLVPSAPHEVLLVLDATAGQNAISQARGFSDAVQCSGIILSKLDGSAKGGVIIPIRQQFNLPVKFIGVGEKPEDFAPFRPHEFVDALFADGNGPPR